MNSINLNNRYQSDPKPFAEAGDVDQYFDVIGMIRRQSRLILGGIVLGILAAVAYFFYATPVYESSASLFIDEPSLTAISVAGSRNAGRPNPAIEKYIEILGSDRIIGPAIETYGSQNLFSLSEFENADDQIEFIKESLYVRSSDKKAQSGVISISLASTVESDATQLLVSMLDVFEEFIVDANEKVGGENVETMTQMRAENSLESEAVQREIDQLMLKPHIQADDGKVLNQFQQQLVKLQEELHLNESQKVKLESLLQRIEQARQQGQPIEDVVIESLDEVDSSPLRHNAEIQQELMTLKMRETELVGDFGNGHPDVVNVREQITLLQGERKRQLLSLFGSYAEDEQVTLDFYSQSVSHVNNKLSLLGFHHDKLEAAMLATKQKSLAIEKDCDRLTFLLGQRDALSQKSMKMMDHAIELGVLRDSKRRNIELIDFPTTAQKVHPKLKLCGLVGVVLGGMMGFAIGLFRETTEQKFHSAKEVHDALGVPVLAELGPYDTRRLKSEEFKHLSGSLISLHRPLSAPAEVYKALRTKLLFDTVNCDSKIIQIVSPLQGDGKSSVAANLAVSLAQSGRQVLLIDGDLRRPTIEKTFALPQGRPGLTTLLIGECEINDVIQTTEIECLSVLTSGQLYSNAAEILTGQRLPELLDALSQKFDYVILDTPPILPVSDAKIIANYADLILMTLRIRKGVQTAAQKAMQRLGPAQDKVAGLIVNVASHKEANGYLDLTQIGGAGMSTSYGRTNAYGDSTGLTAAEVAPIYREQQSEAHAVKES